MRAFVVLAVLACFLALAWSAVIEQVDSDKAVADLLDVDAGVASADENTRQVRQFFGRPYGGFYGRPYGGFYGRPYGGFYGRPYGGFYGRPYGGYYGGFYG
ncbi:shematrin-like protein 2 [Musca domestica]|uniref:Shematrin-like protein 2 n=1 Tax=Musca domestica TaxID=7370 RepID=A0A1I8MEL9_MUSDO|nr:shematrin-like protein 2 [Musca domestica]